MTRHSNQSPADRMSPQAVASLAGRIAAQVGDRRLVVAVVGPPGSGKTTTCDLLGDALLSQHRLSTQIVPMDGFHYDNDILSERGLLSRKGAPETFDVDGLASTLARLTSTPCVDVAVPLFERTLDLSRAGARIILRDTRVVLVEGNYLLLRDAPWHRLESNFGYSVMIECDEQTLRERLIRRWLDLGVAEAQALHKVEHNDLPNARTVAGRSRRADHRVSDKTR